MPATGALCGGSTAAPKGRAGRGSSAGGFISRKQRAICSRSTRGPFWGGGAHRPNPESPEFVPGGPPVPVREALLASGGASGLWALDPTNGSTLWRVPIPEGGITEPVPVAGALLVGTTRYGAFLLSPLDGRPIDGIDLGSGFSQSPAAFGSRAYLLSNAGTLVAVQVEPPVVGRAH